MSKLLLAVLIVVVLALGAWGAVRYAAPARDESPALPARQFAVEGMSCGGCVAAVTDALTKLPGVRSVQVSLEQKKASVVADPAAVPDARITAAITDAGYQGRALPAAPK